MTVKTGGAGAPEPLCFLRLRKALWVTKFLLSTEKELLMKILYLAFNHNYAY